jgi:hypothetical protein
MHDTAGALGAEQRCKLILAQTLSVCFVSVCVRVVFQVPYHFLPTSYSTCKSVQKYLNAKLTRDKFLNLSELHNKKM